MLSGAVFTSTWSYDANGNRITEKVNTGANMEITKDYDEANRVIAVRCTAGCASTAVINELKWYPFGGLKSWKPAHSSFEVTYTQETGSGRLTQIKLMDGTTTKEQIDYTYSWDGNITSQDAAHDSLSRIIQHANGRTYSYDDAGNRTADQGGSYTYHSASSNKLINSPLAAYTFDDAGNVSTKQGGADGGGTKTLSTADDGTVAAISTTNYGTTSYTRDYRNLRLDKAGAGGASTYFYSPEGELVHWVGPTVPTDGSAGCNTGSNRTQTPYETIVYVGGRRLAMTRRVYCSNGNWSDHGPHWFFSDKMDLPRALYRQQSSPIWRGDFDAFATGYQENDDPDGNGKKYRVAFRLPGQIALTDKEGGPPLSSGGLVENWHRIYDTQIGRYLQPDPLGQHYDLAPYGYAFSSPLSFYDPDGGEQRPVRRTAPGESPGGRPVRPPRPPQPPQPQPGRDNRGDIGRTNGLGYGENGVVYPDGSYLPYAPEFAQPNVLPSCITKAGDRCVPPKRNEIKTCKTIEEAGFLPKTRADARATDTSKQVCLVQCSDGWENIFTANDQADCDRIANESSTYSNHGACTGTLTWLQ